MVGPATERPLVVGGAEEPPEAHNDDDEIQFVGRVGHAPVADDNNLSDDGGKKGNKSSSDGEQTIKCSLCPVPKPGSGRFLPSHTIAPFDSTTGLSQVYVHHACAMWAPEVYWDRKAMELKSFYRSFLRGRRQSCSACNERGATVACCIESCTEAFHFLCLASAQCTVRVSARMDFCPSHHKLAAAMPGEPLVAAGLIGLIMARQVVRFPPDSDDDSSISDSVDLCDTPHASHTRLRRYETERICSRLWLVGPVVPEPADVLVSLRQGRLMKGGEQMAVRIGLRLVTKSVADFVIARHARAEEAEADVDPNVPASRCSRAPLFILRNVRHSPIFPAGSIRQDFPMLPSSRDWSPRAQSKIRGAASGARTPAMGEAVRERKRANVDSLWDRLGQQNSKRQKMLANAADGTMVNGVGSLPKVSGNAVAVDAAATHVVYPMNLAAPDAHLIGETAAAAHEEGVAHVAVLVEVGVAAPDGHLAISMAPDDAARAGRVESPVEVRVAAEDVNLLGHTAAALEAAATGRVETFVEGAVLLADAHIRTSTAAAVHAAPVAHVAEPVEVGAAAPAAHLVGQTAGPDHTADGGGVEAPIHEGVAAVDEEVLLNTVAALDTAGARRVEAFVVGGLAVADAQVRTFTETSVHAARVAHVAVPVEVGAAAPAAHLFVETEGAAHTADIPRVESPVELGAVAPVTPVTGLTSAAAASPPPIKDNGMSETASGTGAAASTRERSASAEARFVDIAGTTMHRNALNAAAAATGAARLAATKAAPADGAGALYNNGMPPGVRVKRPSVGYARVKKEGGASNGAVVAVDDEAVIIISDSDWMTWVHVVFISVSIGLLRCASFNCEPMTKAKTLRPHPEPSVRGAHMDNPLETWRRSPDSRQGQWSHHSEYGGWKPAIGSGRARRRDSNECRDQSTLMPTSAYFSHLVKGRGSP